MYNNAYNTNKSSQQGKLFAKKFRCPYPCEDYRADWENREDEDRAPPCIHIITERDCEGIQRKVGCLLVEESKARYQEYKRTKGMV